MEHETRHGWVTMTSAIPARCSSTRARRHHCPKQPKVRSTTYLRPGQDHIALGARKAADDAQPGQADERRAEWQGGHRCRWRRCPQIRLISIVSVRICGVVRTASFGEGIPHCRLGRDLPARAHRRPLWLLRCTDEASLDERGHGGGSRTSGPETGGEIPAVGR